MHVPLLGLYPTILSKSPLPVTVICGEAIAGCVAMLPGVALKRRVAGQQQEHLNGVGGPAVQRSSSTLAGAADFSYHDIYLVMRFAMWSIAAVHEDVVKQLGYLTLGSRLKRLGERLQAQAQVLLQESGTSLSAAYFPLLAALDRLGPLSVGELSQALGVSQPGVTRMLERLETEELVSSESSDSDRRVRRIALSRTGRQLVTRAKRQAWTRIEAAVADACQSLSGPLLAQLAGLEAALAKDTLSARATRLSAGDRRHASA